MTPVINKQKKMKPVESSRSPRYHQVNNRKMAQICDIVLFCTIVFFFFALYVLLRTSSWIGRMMAMSMIVLTIYSMTVYLSLLTVACVSMILKPEVGTQTYNHYTRLIGSTFFTVNVIGLSSHHTEAKSVIFLLNHIYQGALDMFTLPLLPLPKIRIVHGRFPSFPIGKILRLLNGVEIEHGGSFASFMSMCENVLSTGDNLLIFPEGGRRRTFATRHQLPDFRTGTFELAFSKSILLIPILCLSMPNLFGVLYPGSITYKFLSPIHPSQFSSSSHLKSYTWNVMNQAHFEFPSL
jgi:1-acyl-sn-glycerol-3-phosphate acyltransferase